MVYCGKPSKGCQMCRTRRIKCDETKPTCNQCAKARRQCPGYRDEFDLLLRNENHAAERRALKASSSRSNTKKAKNNASQNLSPTTPSPTSSSSPSSSSSSSSSSLSSSSSHTTTSPIDDIKNNQLVPSKSSPNPLVPTSLSIPAKELATCHFMSNFVLVPRQEYQARGYMNFLIPLLNQRNPYSPINPQAEDASGHLHYAFNACALASLGTRAPGGTGGGGDECLRKAFGEYMKALRATQTALRDPEQCTEDSVLAAVLLLSMFENITAKQPNGCAWGSHIQGAVQIVKARGKKQLKTKTGLQLFIAVRTQLIIQTLTSSSPPPMGVDWWTSPSAAYDQHAAACQRLSLLTAQLRSEVVQVMSYSPSPGSAAQLRALMQNAQSIDAALASWLTNCPPSWRHKTICWVPAPASKNPNYAELQVFPGRVDVYPDMWIASVVNLARTTRLVLQSVIVRCAAWCVSPMDYRTTPEYSVAARACGEAITDILASVPFHFGWHLDRYNKESSGISTAAAGQAGNSLGFECGIEGGGIGDAGGMAKGLGGYFLTWPLSCVMGQDYATDAQRAYVIGRLRYIGNALGIRYSHILAQLHVRVPSMLIRRDGLLARPYPGAHDFAKLIGSGRDGPPLLSGYKLNPLQQREAMMQEQAERTRDELLKKAVGGATVEDEVRIAAKKMLAV